MKNNKYDIINRMNWFTIALIGAVSIAIHQFSITKLIKLGLPVHYVNAIIYTIAALILILIYKLTVQSQVELKSYHIIWLVIGVISIIGVIIATLEALNRAVNPGYVGAILSISAVILTILSIIFLKSPITLLKAIGITLALSGAILLGL